MRIALVSPVFHGYWDAISFGLTAAGHDVRPLLYDARPTAWDKAWLKVRDDVPRRLGHDPLAHERRAATDLVAAELTGWRCDLVIVVKGDLLAPSWTDSLRRRGVPVVLWLYDELRRTKHDDATLDSYDLVASYSRLDTAALVENGRAAFHLPLFFDQRLAPSAPPPPNGLDLVFVGARYPGREEVLLAAARAGLRVKAFGREWSHSLVDRARTLGWARPDLPAGPDLSREAAATVMAAASSSLNVHADQDGFTMRTFESAGMGALQLIDRTDVAPLYEPGTEVVVAVGADEVVAAANRALADPGWAAAIRDRAQLRTLAHHTVTRRCQELLAAC